MSCYLVVKYFELRKSIIIFISPDRIRYGNHIWCKTTDAEKPRTNLLESGMGSQSLACWRIHCRANGRYVNRIMESGSFYCSIQNYLQNI